METKKNPIIGGPIFLSLTKFSIPIFFSLLLQALYGAVDLWMVSHFGFNSDVSAVSTGSQTMLIVNGIITGLTMGITILLGDAIGQKDDKKSARIIGTSLWVFIFLAIVLTFILITTASPLAKLLNAPVLALDKTKNYIMICGIGTIFVVGFNVFNGIFCGVGDSKTPLLFVFIACIVNIIGDYILIDIYKLGSTGAAIATVLAQAVSVLFCLCIINKRLPFVLTKKSMAFSLYIAKGIIKLGLPIALLRMCTEISYLVILSIVNVYGEVASSGVGIAEKLVMFILLIPTSYMSSISTFVAQNMGANKENRAKKILWIGIASASVIGGIMSYLSFFQGRWLSSLFIKDPNVISAASDFLKATSIECFVLSISYCFDGYFNGRGKTTLVMVRGVTAALFCRIPFAYVMSLNASSSLFKIGLSTAVAAIYMLVFCSIEYAVCETKKGMKKM